MRSLLLVALKIVVGAFGCLTFFDEAKMETYTLPRETFELLTENFGNKEKAERFARGVESAIDVIQQRVDEKIVAQK